MVTIFPLFFYSNRFFFPDFWRLFQRPQLWYHFTHCKFFFTPALWSFTGVWVAASLLRSPELSSVFWLNLSNAVVCMVSSLTLISNSTAYFCQPLRTFPGTPTIIAITVKFFFYCFLSSLAKSAVSLQNGVPPPQTSVLDMALNNLMIGFQ